MNVCLFIIYFVKLRIKVFLGLHKTINPVYLSWRWRYWNSEYVIFNKRKNR